MATNTKFDPPNQNYFDKTKLFKNCKGVSGVATAGDITSIDLTLTDDVLMTGGNFLARNAAWGDKVDFQVIHPTYGVVAQFITDWYLNPSVVEQSIPKSSYPAKLAAGLTMRVVYHSVGADDVEIAVNYDRDGVGVRKVIIGFSKPRGWFKPFSWAIRAVEQTPYSHVYIRSYSPGLDVDLIYQASGAQVNFMGLANFKHHAVTVSEFEMEISDESYREFMKWAVTNSGAPYGMWQPVGILLMKLFALKKNPFHNGVYAWVCSELVGFFIESFAGAFVGSNIETVGPREIFEFCKKTYKEIEVTT